MTRAPSLRARGRAQPSTRARCSLDDCERFAPEARGSTLGVVDRSARQARWSAPRARGRFATAALTACMVDHSAQERRWSAPRARRGFAALLAAALLAACTPAAAPSPAPTRPIAAAPPPSAPPAAAAPERERPPLSGPERAAKPLAVASSDLPNGLQIAVATMPGEPLVAVRLAIEAGRSADATRPGLAQVTAASLAAAGAADARAPIARIAAAGGDLEVTTGPDRAVLRVTVPRDRLAAALDALASLVQAPPFAPADVARERQRLAAIARERESSAAWATSMIATGDLFALPTDRHPYASFDATAAEIDAITAADCRAFHRSRYVPKAMTIAVAGDVAPDAVRAAVDKAFGGLRGGDPPIVSFTDPVAPETTRITIVDQPKSPAAAIAVATLGPRPTDPAFLPFAVAGRVLGAGLTGRVARALDARGVANDASVEVLAYEQGPSMLVVRTRVAAASAGAALETVLGEVGRLATTPTSPDEAASAIGALRASLAMETATVDAAADAMVWRRSVGLPDDAATAHGAALATVTPEAVSKVAAEHLREGHLVVAIAADAAAIGAAVSRFGDVKVVDPTRGFARKAMPAW